MPLDIESVQRIAGFEMNALRAAEVIGEAYDKIGIPRQGTPIYDINGTLLFYRLPLKRGQTALGYADIASDESFGEPLLATSIGQAWEEKSLLETGRAAAAKRRRGLKFNSVRFVAYSYPKIALQFLLDGAEKLMLELFTWAEVPPASVSGRNLLQPGSFERWSWIDEMPATLRRARSNSFKKRVGLWGETSLRRIDPTSIHPDNLRIREFAIKLSDTREVRYSPLSTDHSPCYELRGQQTNVWCVGASTEMLLNFYRYSYDQVRIATELGLGTLAAPNGLPYSRVGDVVTVIERLTSNALDASMVVNPGWNFFQDEIRANRPLISFIPGHSRTVAGYTRSLLALVNQIPFRGLLVYDPWPPSTGVITRWENFATQVYQYGYSAVLRQV